MRAWLLDDQRGLTSLRLAQIDSRSAAEGEVVLRVKYAALNPADRYLAEGQYPAKPTFPHILGRDGIGSVVEVGAGVKGIERGQEMLLLRSEAGVNQPGTLADEVVVPAESLIAPPKGWSAQEAAAAPLVYLTAYQALTMWGDLPERSAVLVTGASGGVGVASIHLAHAMGHVVVGLSRSESKRTKLIELGATHALDPTDPNWPKILKTTLAGKRVDLAIDNIGGDTFPRVIETLGDRGRVSVVGRLAGPVPQFNTASLIFRRVRIGGVMVGAYAAAESREAWEKIVGLMNRSGVRPVVDSVFEFEKLIDAFEKLARGPMGKVLIQVR